MVSMSILGKGEVAHQISKANRVTVRNVRPALLTVTQIINITLEPT